MNWIDWTVLGVWGAAGLWGLMSGLLQMCIPFISLLAALALSSRFGASLGGMFAGFTDSEIVQKAAGFLLAFVVVFVAGSIVGFFLRQLLNRIPVVGPVNKLGGLAVGVVIGFVLLSGVMTGLQRWPIGDSEALLADSALGTFLADNFDVVIRAVGLIPSSWTERLPFN